MKLFQILDEFEIVLCQIKSKLSGHILETHFIHSKGLSSYPTHGTLENKVLLNDLNHMTKRAATPINGNVFFYRNTELFGPLQ